MLKKEVKILQVLFSISSPIFFFLLSMNLLLILSCLSFALKNSFVHEEFRSIYSLTFNVLSSSHLEFLSLRVKEKTLKAD